VYPSLGIAATRGTGYPRAWAIPIARISPATPSTLSSTPSSANIHGVLAPHAHRRSQVVRHGRPAPDVNACACAGRPRAAGTPDPWTWAALLRRVFGIDVLACPRCGGRLRLIATMEDPAVVGKILAPLGLLHSADSPGPAPPSADLRAAAPFQQSSAPSRGWTLPLQEAS
jgi:hypothetical protein